MYNLNEQSERSILETLQEIVNHECERYYLTRLGILSSVEEGFKSLSSMVQSVNKKIFQDKKEYANWKKEILFKWYKELKCRDYFIRYHKEQFFYLYVLELRKDILARIRSRWEGETIDKHLAIPERTLAFKLSRQLVKEHNHDLFLSVMAMQTPADLNDFCREQCVTLYPVSLDNLLLRLTIDDEDFWNDISLLFKTLTHIITFGLSPYKQLRKDVEDEVWVEAVIKFREKVMNKDLPVFESSLHLRNYMQYICKNKVKETLRKENKNPEPTDMERKDEPDDLSEPFDRDSIEDIDLYDEKAVKQTLIRILICKIQPWYSILTKDLEEKMEVFILHHELDMHYKDIAKDMLPEGNEEELQRLEAKLRKDTERFRKGTVKKYMDIIEERKRSYENMQ